MNEQEQKTILLVEDEAILGMSESIQLKKYGYDVIHVLSGRKAIDAVSNVKNDVDLILMDINLGHDIDGTETATMILKDHDIPVLFLSSHLEREVVAKTENITSYGYVVKNSGITVLDASIKMAFRLHDSYKIANKQKTEILAKETELKFYEKRYRRLFESAKDGILILDAKNGMILDVNPYLIEMLGYSKEQFLTKKIWDLNASNNVEYSKKMFKELQEKEYVRYTDFPLQTADGKLIYVGFVSNIYLVDNEKVIQCNIRDITERREHEIALNENIDQKEALLREIQHRTKNSFNMITSMIFLRTNATDSEEIKDALEDLNLRVKSISDLYTLLYETNSIYEVQLKTYCDKVIESMLKFSEIITINKNIEEITISTKNAATIGMILVELLSNAIKYAFPETREGEIDIELKKKDNRLKLSVRDNGIGLQKSFDISKTKTLGLHLVYLMVNQLNGEIKYEIDNGTKFLIECDL
jgi:PAS domain S-box-containing protein